MAAAFRAAARGGNGITTQTTSQTITVPTTGPGGSVVAGDVAVLFVDAEQNPTLTTPTGWSLLRTDDAGTNTRAWIFTKDLVGGDIGAGVSLSFSVNTRPTSSMSVWSGITRTGILSNVLTNTTAASNNPLPTLGSVVAGTLQIAAALRRRSGPEGTITFPSPYTNPTGTDSATSFATGANTYLDQGYVLSSAGGTVGGETTTTTAGTSIGSNYVLAFALAATNIDRLRIGDTTPADIRLGDSAVSKVYVGDTQVWP